MGERRRLPKIGWREWLALPSLGIEGIKAKVDTGARTSSLHAFEMEPYEIEGDPWIRFSIHPHQRSDQGEVRVEVPLLDHRRVRPSTGQAQERPVIQVPVTLGGATWEIEVTLVRRDMMGFRMLLGRQAIRGRFLIDPGRSYLMGKKDGLRPGGIR